VIEKPTKRKIIEQKHDGREGFGGEGNTCSHRRSAQRGGSVAFRERQGNEADEDRQERKKKGGEGRDGSRRRGEKSKEGGKTRKPENLRGKVQIQT